MRKLYLLSLAIAFAAFSKISAEPIRSYQELTEAMQTGNHLVFFLDLPHRPENPRMPGGYFTPNSIILMPRTEAAPERIVTSLMHFSDHTGRPIYEYVKFTIYADGNVTVRTTYYDPQTFSSMGTSHTINCSLGKGIEIHR